VGLRAPVAVGEGDVQSVSLDEAMANVKDAFVAIKVDVEGHEIAVFGVGRTFSSESRADAV
jgi:hypothetical protein